MDDDPLAFELDSDGCDENSDFEAYYHHADEIEVNIEHECLEIFFGDGGVDGLTRVSFADLEKIGFVRKAD